MDDLHLDWTDRPSSSSASCASAGLDDVPGKRLDRARRRAGPASGPADAPAGYPRRPVVVDRPTATLVLRRVQPESRSPMSAEELAARRAPCGGRAPRDGLDMSAVTVTPIDGWSPDQYERFRSERQQPFDDLLTLCHPVPGGRVVDLGCGTGDLTRILHEEMAAQETVGIDSSPAMLARAQSTTATCAGLSFAQGDIATWLDEGLDLVFANASLQWIDDHLNLLARMRTALGPDGQLAFQVPANYRHPSHLLALAVANEPPSSMRSTETSPKTGAASSCRPSSTPTCSTSSEPRTRSCGWRSTATSSSRPARSSSGSWAPCSRPTASD